MLALLIGLFIGLVLGLTGAGGSLFAVPLLVLLLGYSPSIAIGLSLGIVAFNAMFGMALQLRSGNIQWAPAIAFLLIGSLSAPLGNYLKGFVPDAYLLFGFVILVIIVAIKLWINAVQVPENAKVVRASPYVNPSKPAICPVTEDRFEVSLPCILGMSGASIITGLLSGLFGVGGGFIIVPSLVLITGIAIHQAVATSLVIISAISLSGFVGFLLSNDTSALITDYGLDFIRIISAGFVAILISRTISSHITGSALQKAFALLMVILSVVTLFQGFN